MPLLTYNNAVYYKSEGVVYDVKGVLDRNLIDGRL